MCSYYIKLSNKILLCYKNLVFLENDKVLKNKYKIRNIYWKKESIVHSSRKK